MGRASERGPKQMLRVRIDKKASKKYDSFSYVYRADGACISKMELSEVPKFFVCYSKNMGPEDILKIQNEWAGKIAQ